MKIEMGESLVQSYFRCVENCLITQTNWKVSGAWKISDETLEKTKNLYEKIQSHSDFKDIFKQNSLEQTLKQAELDVIGISGDKIYMAEVAFHEGGLNYGSKEETKDKVCKKLLRAYLIGLAYFPNYSYEIMFVSPKVNNATEKIICEYFAVLDSDFTENNKVTFKYIANDDFKEKILLPTLNDSATDADTSELFLRSVKMLDLFGLVNKDGALTKKKVVPGKIRTCTIDTGDEIEEIKKKLEKWNISPNQKSYKIVSAMVNNHIDGIDFFEFEKEINSIFADNKGYGSIRSMMTNKGNAYGKIFIEDPADGLLKFDPEIKEFVLSMEWG